MKIYTKRGDAGTTGLFDGRRVRKDSARVSACGDVDELNAAAGLAASLLGERCGDLRTEIEALQRDLFALGALLGDPRRDGEAEPADAADRLALGAASVERLEAAIDRWEAELTPLRRFILPGGRPVAAALHVARTVARRAERAVVALPPEVGVSAVVLAYLNRVSDFLFVAARVANHRESAPDATW